MLQVVLLIQTTVLAINTMFIMWISYSVLKVVKEDGRRSK